MWDLWIFSSRPNASGIDPPAPLDTPDEWGSPRRHRGVVTGRPGPPQGQARLNRPARPRAATAPGAAGPGGGLGQPPAGIRSGHAGPPPPQNLSIETIFLVVSIKFIVPLVVGSMLRVTSARQTQSWLGSRQADPGRAQAPAGCLLPLVAFCAGPAAGPPGRPGGGEGALQSRTCRV